MGIWADSGQSRVRRVVEGGFRRSNLVLLVEHSALALAAVFGGLILLLLLGTQIFDGRWLLLLALAGAAVVFVRVRGRILSRYRVAQLVDRRLQLNDSLSTAWFLLESPAIGGLAQTQIDRAEETARTVKPAAVFPFVWRRTWSLAAALFAVAFGLFALRYLVTSSLSLKQALIPLSFPLPAEVLERIENLAGRNSLDHKNQLKGSLPNAQREASDGSDPSSRDTNRAEASTGKPDAGNNNQRSSESRDTHEAGGQQSQSADRANSPDQTQSAENSKQRPDQAANGRPSSNEQSAAKESSQENRGQNPGLLDRMKDALSGLMAKMRQEQGELKNSERSPQQKSGEQAAESRSRNGQMQQNSQSPARKRRPGPAAERARPAGGSSFRKISGKPEPCFGRECQPQRSRFSIGDRSAGRREEPQRSRAVARHGETGRDYRQTFRQRDG